MTSTSRARPASEPVLPSSRQPVPVSEEHQPPEPRKRRRNRQRADGRRSPAEIEAELQEATERLATNVDRLVERLHPRQTARRWAGTATRLLVTPSGLPRPEVVGAVVGGLAGVGYLIWRARRRS